VPSSGIWRVPWAWPTTALLLLAWALAFALVGHSLLPALAERLGVPPLERLGDRGCALYALAADATAAAAGGAVLVLGLRQYAPLPRNWFSLRPLRRRHWLPLLRILACLPLVELLALSGDRLLPLGAASWADSLASAGAAHDGVAAAAYAAVLVVLAPLWEEGLFRAFLLPSLTRYLPAHLAIAASALLFAVAHGNPAEAAPLLALGCLCGAAFVRTRGSWAAAAAVHAAWNACSLARALLF